jgi:antitoxin MazE
MQTRVQKWGNSLAVRIPKSFALESHLTQDSLIEISIEAGKIILQPVKPGSQSLAQLLEAVTDENLHDEINTGISMGQEAW